MHIFSSLGSQQGTVRDSLPLNQLPQHERFYQNSTDALQLQKIKMQTTRMSAEERVDGDTQEVIHMHKGSRALSLEYKKKTPFVVHHISRIILIITPYTIITLTPPIQIDHIQ